MPVKSEKQRRLMGAAFAYKRGENKNASEEVKRVTNNMIKKQLGEMTSKPISKKEKRIILYQIKK